MIRITLPSLPPPLHACFTNVARNGRAATPRYTAWAIESLHAIQRQNPGCVRGPIAVDYQFKRPDKRRRDLGNLEKATSDLLVKAGIIDDDSLIVDLRMSWGGDEAVTITVKPAEVLP